MGKIDTAMQKEIKGVIRMEINIHPTISGYCLLRRQSFRTSFEVVKILGLQSLAAHKLYTEFTKFSQMIVGLNSEAGSRYNQDRIYGHLKVLKQFKLYGQEE